VLTPPEAAQLFTILAELKAAGSAVILITHKLDEVMRVSDRVTVMRHGRMVARLETRATTAEAIARAMVGHEVAPDRGHAGTPVAADAPPALEVVDLSVERSRGALAVAGVSLSVRPGEILGVAGVEGNGQTELVEVIAGLRPARRGRVRLGGVELGRVGVRARFAAGLAHVPEDRHRRGLVLDLTVAENLLLGREDEVSAFAFWPGRLAARAAPVLERHDVRPARPEAAARTLSGGNQQKVVVARELGRKARVVLAAHPTRGVDVGAVARIWQDLRAVRAAGAAVLLVSADLAELFALSDRLLVMYRGRVAAEVDPRTATPEEVGLHMTGAASEAAP
jgi:simple sugar transport system ATP-binding protein